MFSGFRIPFDLEAATLLFMAFGLCYYAYVYFFPFDEGIGGAPVAVKAAKDVAYAVFLGAALLAVRWTVGTWQEWIFLPLAVSLVLVSLLHATHTGLAVQLIENIKNVLVYLPVFWLMFRLTHEQASHLVRRMQRVFMVLALVQVAFSVAFHEAGSRLWMDGLFAGWIANPNSFALLLNLVTAVLLAAVAYSSSRWRIATSTILVAVMTYGVLHTVSGSQLLIHYALLCYCAGVLLSRGRTQSVFRLLPAALVVVAVSFGAVDWLRMGLQPAFDTLRLARQEDPARLSLSASRRVEMIRVAVAVTTKGPAQALMGDMDNNDYHRLDGQFWVFLANGGLVTLLAFTVPALLIYVVSLRRALAGGRSELALHLMIVAFGATFVASRVLQYFPFNFLFLAIAGLALRPTAQNVDSQQALEARRAS